MDERINGKNSLRVAVHAENSPLVENFLRPASPFPLLADYQVHRNHIELMCTDANENWPAIKSIECGTHERKYPYIAIRIDPYTHENIQHHNGFIRSIREQLPQYRAISFFCLGRACPSEITAATLIYERQPIPIQLGTSPLRLGYGCP